jgi:hypothetical protein
VLVVGALESGLTISAGRKWSAQALPRFRLGEVSHQTTKKLVASRTWAREKSLSLIGFRIYCGVIPAEDMGLRHLDQRIRYVKVAAWPISRASLRSIEVGGATIYNVDLIRAALGML